MPQPQVRSRKSVTASPRPQVPAGLSVPAGPQVRARSHSGTALLFVSLCLAV